MEGDEGINSCPKKHSVVIKSFQPPRKHANFGVSSVYKCFLSVLCIVSYHQNTCDLN